MEIITSLVGAKFRGREACDTIRELSIGDKLRLEAEPENPYDENAVKVMTPEHMLPAHLGYIPKTDNAALAEVLAVGSSPRAEIIAFANELSPTLRVTWDDEED